MKIKTKLNKISELKEQLTDNKISKNVIKSFIFILIGAFIGVMLQLATPNYNTWLYVLPICMLLFIAYDIILKATCENLNKELREVRKK